MHIVSFENIVKTTIQKDFNIEKYQSLYTDKKINNSLFLLIIEISNYFNFNLIKKYVRNECKSIQFANLAYLYDLAYLSDGSTYSIDIYIYCKIFTLNLSTNIVKNLNQKDWIDISTYFSMRQ